MNIAPNNIGKCRQATPYDYAELFASPTSWAVTVALQKTRLSSRSDTPEQSARKIFRGIDFVLNGRAYQNKKPDRRATGYFFPEDWSFHPHLHGVVALPGGHDLLPDDQAAFINDVCQCIYPDSSVECKTLHHDYGWMMYSSKHTGFQHSIIMAIDFWKKSPTCHI